MMSAHCARRHKTDASTTCLRSHSLRSCMCEPSATAPPALPCMGGTATAHCPLPPPSPPPPPFLFFPLGSSARCAVCRHVARRVVTQRCRSNHCLPLVAAFHPPPHLPLFGLMFCSANVSRWWCASARCLAWKSRTIAKRECCFIVLHAPSSTNSLPPFSLSLSLPQHHHRRSRCR